MVLVRYYWEHARLALTWTGAKFMHMLNGVYANALLLNMLCHGTAEP